MKAKNDQIIFSSTLINELRTVKEHASFWICKKSKSGLMYYIKQLWHYIQSNVLLFLLDFSLSNHRFDEMTLLTFEGSQTADLLSSFQDIVSSHTEVLTHPVLGPVPFIPQASRPLVLSLRVVFWMETPYWFLSNQYSDLTLLFCHAWFLSVH